MNINLDPIDDFQRRYGQQKTFERAIDFMHEYACQIRTALPPLAARTFETAKRNRQGTATPEECKRVWYDTGKYISEHKAWGDHATPEYCIMRGMAFLVQDRPGPAEERISELVSWFLAYVNEFEDHSENAAALIQQHFPHST
jgi:hypothetical protein